MKKKHQNIQIGLLLIGIILFILTYFYYPQTQKELNTKDTYEGVEKDLKIEKDQKKSASKTEETLPEITIEDAPLEISQGEGTAFESVEYEGLYDLDKPFVVSSEKAFILNSEPDVVYMTNMNVSIILSDGRTVEIKSDQGKYNKLTYDCFFEKNVRASDGETKIFADNLDLLATKNFVDVYNNVSLISANDFLRADKVNYDFETKYFKISMFDDSKIKIKVTR